MAYFTYIMANRKHGTIYVGVTNNIARRVHEHRTGALPGFTKKYGVKRLVHVEIFDSIHDAIRREKILKHWTRVDKIKLIEQANAEWQDLHEVLNR